PPSPTRFPYTTLFRSLGVEARAVAAEVELVRRGRDQPLRERVRLREEEPVPVDEAELLVGAAPHLGRRDDVEDGEPRDALRVVRSEEHTSELQSPYDL